MKIVGVTEFVTSNSWLDFMVIWITIRIQEFLAGIFTVAE